MQTTLPVFRIAGLHATIRATHQADDLAALWHDYFSGSLKDALPAFSTTVYCVRHNYQPDGSFCAIVGRLVANDAPLPDGARDVWLPPQQYQVYTLPEKTQQAALPVWAQVDADGLSRRLQADFESYPAFGEARLYVGIDGEVIIAEEY